MALHPISRSQVTAIGSYVPERVLDNHDLEQMVDTQEEWIVKRTGIHERRMAKTEQHTSDLCIEAVEDMVKRHPGLELQDIDMILVATSTPDFPFPSVACMLQDRFSIDRCGALDVSAACAGFVYALNLADALVTAGQCRKVLVVGGETLSKVTDYTDRTTCILFGDGAGAALVEREERTPGFIHSTSGTDGSAGIHVYRTGLSDHLNGVKLKDNGKIVQDGRAVFRLAVRTLSEEIPRFLSEAGRSVEEIDWFVPHSANLRIIDSVCEKIGLPTERIWFSGERYGNTSAASIPLALCQGIDTGKIREGDMVLLSGFGSGFTHAHTLLRWGF
ncbi:ketoacyl-ACP synthase III [Salinithrix halophila]|uniref:Beta-ketoacyl-[acyl-carrier-protein] synthase III n=1 Tax=Salinithrix halophila TaxID=1485204 RepID=A0ABV8JB70_9BACL